MVKNKISYKLVMKLLILVISNDYYPYSEFKKWWKCIKKPDWVEIYFVEARENNTTSVEIVEDTIYIRGRDSLQPGIWKKQIYAMKYLLNKEYDYLIRSNLSTFYNFDLLKSYLLNKPKTRLICGNILYIPKHYETQSEFSRKTVFGCSYIMSRDVVEHLVDWDSNEIEYMIPDDHVISYLIDDMQLDIDELPIAAENDTFNTNMILRIRTDDRSKDIDRFKELVESWNMLH